MAQGKSRKFIKTFLNVPRWIGVDQLAAAGSTIKSLAKTLITVKKPQFEETFEEAVKRMGLTEKDLEAKQKNLLILAMIYLVSAIGMLAYGWFLFSKGYFLATVSAVSLSVLLAAFFFREHFWYVQIKNKRLGYSFKEWLHSII